MLHTDDNLDRIICMHIRAKQLPTVTEQVTDDVMLRFGWGPCKTEGCESWTPDPFCEHCMARQQVSTARGLFYSFVLGTLFWGTFFALLIW